MVEANIVSYWSCSKLWRTVNKYVGRTESHEQQFFVK